MGCTKINSTHRHKINHQLLRYQSNELIQHFIFILNKTVPLSLLFFLFSNHTINKINSKYISSIFVCVWCDRLSMCASSSSFFSSNSFKYSHSISDDLHRCSIVISFFSIFFPLLFHFLFSSHPFHHLLLLCLCPRWNENIYKPEWIKWLHALQINASAIISFKIFSSLVVVAVVVVCVVLLDWLIDWLRCSVADNFSMISKHITDSLQVLLAIVSFHGLEAKPKPKSWSNTSHQQQRPSRIHSINRRSTQSTKQEQEKKRKCKEIPIGILICIE